MKITELISSAGNPLINTIMDFWATVETYIYSMVTAPLLDHVI